MLMQVRAQADQTSQLDPSRVTNHFELCDDLLKFAIHSRRQFRTFRGRGFGLLQTSIGLSEFFLQTLRPLGAFLDGGFRSFLPARRLGKFSLEVLNLLAPNSELIDGVRTFLLEALCPASLAEVFLS